MREDDKLERIIEDLRSDNGAIREAIATLTAQLAHWHASESRSYQELHEVRKDLSVHITDDAAKHAALAVDMRRLWWGAGVLFTSFIAFVGSAIAKILP